METDTNGIVDHPKYVVTLENGARLVDGKIGKAVSLNGFGQYVDIGSHDDKCMANLEKCKHGLTISMWLKARRLDDNTYFLSTPTYALFYKDSRLQASFRHRGKVWEVYTPNIKSDRWHNVDLSWTQDGGLEMFIDGVREASSSRYREAMQGDQPASESVQIGKSDDVRSRSATGIIDEVQFWYGPRDQVVASGQLGGVVNHQAVLFERAIRQFDNGTSAIVTPQGTIYLLGGPTRAAGDQHGAIRVNGKNQYIYVGDDVICTGNLENCPQGFTVRFALRPEQLLNNMYFLDSFPLSIYYRDGKLFATARTPTKSWTVSTPGIRENDWQDIEITWHPQAGLTMTLNGAEAVHQTFGTPQDEVREWSRKLYLGRSLSDMVRERYANAIFERLDIWNARKQYLETHKIIRTDRNGGVSGVVTPAPPVVVRPATRPPPVIRTQSPPVLPPIIVDPVRPPVIVEPVRPPVIVEPVQPPVIINPVRPDNRFITETGNTSLNVIAFNNREISVQLGGSVGTILRPVTARPRPRPSLVTTQRPVISPGRTFFGGYDVTDFDKYFSNIVRFHGNAYIRYDFNQAGYERQEILTPVNNETFTFQFITSENNGLIWLDDRPSEDLRMYLAIQDGFLMFYIDEGNGQIQSIKLNSRRIKELNDWEWHTFRMHRFGKELRFYIDEEYVGTLTTVREIQLIGRGDVYLGGTPIDYTDSVVTQSYNGGITKILYVKQSPSLLLRVSLMQYITQIHGGSGGSTGIDVIVPGQPITPRPTQRPPPITRPPVTLPPVIITNPPITRPPRPQIITLFDTISFKGGFHLKIEGFLDIRSGGILSFRFRTLERKSVLFFVRRQGSTNQLFLAFEIYDGKLYFISDFGARTRRLLISNVIVNDGTWQNVKLEFMDQKLFISLNGIQQSLDLTQAEMIQAYFDDGIYIGGYPEGFKSWYIWAENYDQYKGCFGDLSLQNIGTDMRGPLTSIPIGQFLSMGCMTMNRQCSSTSPCRNGLCINGVDRYYCDCAGTGFSGTRCEDFAVIGGFQGNEYITYYYTTNQVSHTNDIALRFKSFLRNAFLFQTVSSSTQDYLRGELDNGRIKITLKVEGQRPQRIKREIVLVFGPFVFYVGSNLNDNMWHNLFIKRRGSQLELFVDSETPVKHTIEGENFYLHYNKIYFGGVGDSGVSLTDVHPNYLGLMQSVYWDNLDLFGKLKQLPSSAVKIIWITNEGQMNRFIYRPITYTSHEVFSQLSPLYMGLSFRLMFNFKTREDSGVILYSKGAGSRFIAVELVDGYINFHFNNGYSTKSEIIRTPLKVNNNEWHMFEVREFEQGGRKYYKVTVDRTSRDIQIPGDQKLELTGNLYIGGLSSAMFRDVGVTSVLKSTHGFMGCLASVDLNGQSPDLISSANNRESVLSTCTDIQVCPANACANGGICLPGVANHRCICDLTGYYGDRCTDYPIGVYFNRELSDKLFGVIKYRLSGANSQKDEIAFGFMTYEMNGILMRIDSGGANEFIELRLENGYLIAEYDTGSGLQTIRVDSSRFNDGLYHVVKFTRTADGGFLTIDGVTTTIAHQVFLGSHEASHSVFDQVQYVYIGGRLDASNNIMNPFTGIIGGAYYNTYRFIDLGESASGATWIGDYYVITTGQPGYILFKKVKPTAPPRVPLPPETGPYPIPGDLGGGGVVVPGASGGGGAVPPGGSVGIGNPGTLSGGAGGPVGPSGGAGPITGALTGGGVGGGVPVVPAAAGGARAGAVMGAVLGTMAFLASLMWAFWGLKPGVVSLGGGGGGGGPPAMSISSPTATNLPVATAVGGGGGAGSGGGGAGGAKLDEEVTVVNGGAGSGGGGGIGGGAGSGSAFTSYYTSSAATAGGGGGGVGGGVGGGGVGGGVGEGYGGGAGGGYGMSNAEYSSTMTRTVTGGGGGGGVGGYGAGYGTGGGQSYSASRMYSSSTMGGQSQMDAGESTTADYDLASGTGTMMGVGGGGSNTMNKYSTMQSSYQVQNVRTVLVNNQGTQQLVTYHSASGAVTPGAAGDEVRVDCCLMNEDGRTVVTGSTLGPPQVWNMQTGELLRIMKGDTVGSTNLHLACNDRLLVGAVHADLEINEFSTRKGVTVKKLQIWDFVTGKPLDMGVEETCSALCVMSDPDKVVFARSDKFGNATSIVVWDLLGNQPIKEMRYDAPVGNNDYVNFLALSQNDRYCVAGFTNSFDNYAEFVVFDMTLTSFNINDANILRLDANPECTAILPHEEACTGLRNGDLVIWNLRTGQADRQLLASGGHAHSREVKAVTLSQDNKYLVSASADHTMKLWDMTTEKPVQTMTGHTDEVWCSAISADNEIIVSGSRDGTIRLWRCKNGSEICAFNTGVDVFNVTMSQDKGTIVALGDKFGARKLIMLQVVRTKIRRQTTS